jgi:hypothetical protein
MDISLSILISLAAIVSLVSSTTAPISMTFTPTSPQTNASALQFSCVNNSWTIPKLSISAMTSINLGGLNHLITFPTVNMTWYINGTAAEKLTITGSTGVTASVTIGNVWQFALLGEQSQISAGISLGTCIAGQPQPAIALNLSTNTLVQVTGNSFSGIPTLINSFNISNVFNFTITVTITNPTTAPTVPPTAAPTAALTSSPTSAAIIANPTTAPAMSSGQNSLAGILQSLPTGAIIGAGAGLGTVAIGTIAFFVVRSRRNSKGFPTFEEDSKMARTKSVLLKQKDEESTEKPDSIGPGSVSEHASVGRNFEVSILVRTNGSMAPPVKSSEAGTKYTSPAPKNSDSDASVNTL